MNMKYKTIKYIGAVTLVFGMSAFGGNAERRNVRGEQKVLTVEEMRSRFEVVGELFIFDKSGKVLLRHSGEQRVWQMVDKDGKLKSNWGNGSNHHADFNLSHEWWFEKDGALKVKLVQYEKVEESKNGEAGDMKNPLGEKTVDVDKFTPIVWQSLAEKEKVVVARLTPRLRPVEGYMEPKDLWVVAQGLTVFDNEGALWLSDLDVQGKFISVGTHKGTLAISYHPFKGSKVMGVAEGQGIKLGLGGGKNVTMLSRSALLPAGMRVKVYGVYKPDQKTSSVKSTKSSATTDEERFLEKLK